MDLKDSTSEGSMGSLQPSSIQIFANTSTLHGIRHVFVYGPVTIRRLLWTLAFVGSLGLLLVESSDRVAFYFSYQHVTKMDEVVANSLVFPAVTICNLNEFRFSRLTTNDLYHAGELLALLDVNLQIPNPHLADPAVLAILQEKANFKQYKPKVFNMQEFLARVGHDLKDMMLYCKFKGQECSHEDFKTLPLDASPNTTAMWCGHAGRRSTQLHTCHHPKLGPAIPKRDVTLGFSTIGDATYSVVAHKKRTVVQDLLHEEQSTHNTEYLMILSRVTS